MGEIFALICAVLWAFAVLLLRRSGEQVGPFALNLFRVAFSLPLLVISVAVAGTGWVPTTRPSDYLLLTLSGVVGIAVADTLFHRSLNLVGAGITAIIDTFYAPATITLAFLFLGERLGTTEIIGMLLIMSAVVLSGTLQPPRDRTRRELIEGILTGVTGIGLLAGAVVMIKPVVDHAPVLWVTMVRQAAALLALLVAAAISRRRREHLRVLRPSTTWRFMVPATVLGSYLALIFWIAGMKFTLVGTSAILTQSSTVFILVLSVLLLREPISGRKIFSAALALAGVLLVTLR